MLFDYNDLRRRLRDAGRTSGLSAGLRSWINELRRDYTWAERKAQAIQQDRSEPETKAALILEAKAVFADAIALPESGLTAERRRRRATREIATLTRAAMKLDGTEDIRPNGYLRMWQSAAIDIVQHPKQPAAQRDERTADLLAGFQRLERCGTEYRREQDRMRERGW